MKTNNDKRQSFQNKQLSGIPKSILKEEDGYDLWLRYLPLTNAKRVAEYKRTIEKIVVHDHSNDQIITNALDELQRAFHGLFGTTITEESGVTSEGCVVLATAETLSGKVDSKMVQRLSRLGDDGFIIETTRINGYKCILVTSSNSKGLLYGSFYLIRMIQLEKSIENLKIEQKPDMTYRIIQHWDNLNGTIERGYAGKSLWQWDELPNTFFPCYRDYLRANASIGINGVVLNNVNAEAELLTPSYIEKIAALALLFRSYGQRIYLSINFDSPKINGGFITADPCDSGVRRWWEETIDGIYKVISDFGGFVIKGDSEGQPGPKKYGITFVQAANIFGDILKPHNGILMWRTFAGAAKGADRCKRDFDEYHSFDDWNDNVLLLSKYGPHDFHVNEPFHPLLSTLKNTQFALETQTANEHRGQANNAFYNGMLWRNYLDRDTYRDDEGSFVKNIYRNQKLSGWVNVAGIGSDPNWSRNHLNQVNWFASGIFSWNLDSDPVKVAREWAQMTFGPDPEVIATIGTILTKTWSIRKKLTGPLGCMKVTVSGNQYEPVYGYEEFAVWNFHRSDTEGTGFRLDTNASGTSNGRAEQYPAILKSKFENIDTCPDEWVAWFHHVPYNHVLKNGNTAVQEIYKQVYDGYKETYALFEEWMKLESKIDSRRFTEQLAKLWIQVHHARSWVENVIPYFEHLSGVRPPEISLPELPGDKYSVKEGKYKGIEINGKVSGNKLRFSSSENYATFPDKSESSIIWNIPITKQGRYYLLFKYQTPGIYDAQMSLCVNNTLVNEKIVLKYNAGHTQKSHRELPGGLENTGAYWSAIAVSHYFDPGMHEIRIINSDVYRFNIDALVIIESNMA